MITYPLDTAKAILSVSSKTDYPNLRSVFIKTYYERGFKTFYRGMLHFHGTCSLYQCLTRFLCHKCKLSGIYVTILGVLPYAGSSFFTYETLKLIYQGMLIISYEVALIHYLRRNG